MEKNIIKINHREESWQTLVGHFDNKTFYGDYANGHYALICQYMSSGDISCVSISNNANYARNTEDFVRGIIDYSNRVGEECDSWFVENEHGICFPVEFLFGMKKKYSWRDTDTNWNEFFYPDHLEFKLLGFHECYPDTYCAYITLNGYGICPMYVHYDSGLYELWSDIGIEESSKVLFPDESKNKYVTSMGHHHNVYNCWTAMFTFIKDFAFEVMNLHTYNFDISFGEGHNLVWTLFNANENWGHQPLTDKALAMLVKTGANK